MLLSEKNSLVSPPTLTALLEPIAQAVQYWPGILAATRWDAFQVEKVVDGINFYVGDEELGHLHLNGELHVATSPVLRQALVARSLARPLRWGGAAYPGWTEFSVLTAADAAHATWLLKLNYQRLCSWPEGKLVAEVIDYQLLPQ